MSSVNLKILAVGKKSGKCWECNFSKDSGAHRSPLGEASGCFLNREQPADVSRGEYQWIILIKKVPVHNGLIFLTCSKARYGEMSAFSCTQPQPGNQQLLLSPGCRGHLWWFVSCWRSPPSNRLILLGVDLIPCTWKFMFLDLKQPL